MTQEPRTRSERYGKNRKKKGSFWSKFRTFLGVLLILFALGLLALNPIKDRMIANRTEANTIANIDRDRIRAGQEAEVTYDFNDIENIDAANVIRDNINPEHLPVIGGIAIPEVEMNLPIYKGVSNEGMYLGAGTLNPNQEMGKSNYPLASHHSIDDSLLFAPLMKVEYGDTIYLTDLDKVYEYEIDYIETVHPDRVDLIQPISENETPIVTLVTCDYSLNDRVIVRGSLVKEVEITHADDKMLNAFKLPTTTAG